MKSSIMHWHWMWMCLSAPEQHSLISSHPPSIDRGLSNAVNDTVKSLFADQSEWIQGQNGYLWLAQGVFRQIRRLWRNKVAVPIPKMGALWAMIIGRWDISRRQETTNGATNIRLVWVCLSNHIDVWAAQNLERRAKESLSVYVADAGG